ncbi:MAG: hypothetical protein IJW60_04500 [Clostridia bacterium]|nr:hypothetical protein [Clostridia bacterium]
MNDKTTLLPSSGKYKNARLSLLIILLLSVVNVFVMFADTYFLFSAHIALVIANVGFVLKLETGENAYLLIGIVLSLITLIPYLVCWIFSKKHAGWLIAALVLFAIDTVFLVIDIPAYLDFGDFSIFIDLIVHVIVLYELVVGVKAGFAMQREAKEAAQIEENLSSPFDFDEEIAPESAETREMSVRRKKSFVGCAIPMVVYVNGVEVCRLKNGQAETLVVPAAAFELGVALKNGFAVNKLTVESGFDSLAYTVWVKTGFSSASVVIDRE